MLKWFLTKPYTKAMYISAVATVIMAVVAIIMGWTLIQNSNALKISAESLDLQRKEFKIRNRPFIVMQNFRFGGPAKAQSGALFPYSIQFEVVNISDVPANHLSGVYQTFLNGSKTYVTIVPPSALARGATSKGWVCLSKDLYEAATNSNNRFSLVAEMKYSGMLGEKPEEYQTKADVYYSSPEKSFIYDKALYQ